MMASRQPTHRECARFMWAAIQVAGQRFPEFVCPRTGALIDDPTCRDVVARLVVEMSDKARLLN